MNLREQIIEKINDRVYENYTLYEKKASLEDVFKEILKMENEVESPYFDVSVWIKKTILDIISSDNIGMVVDDNGFFVKVIVKDVK
jgi:hypothetical protein